MNLKFDKATSTLTASVSPEEQICLNDAELPIDAPTAVRGRELKREIYTERARIMRDWLSPVEVHVLLENTPITDAEHSTPANTRAQSPRSV